LYCRVQPLESSLEWQQSQVFSSLLVLGRLQRIQDKHKDLFSGDVNVYEEYQISWSFQ